VDISFGNAVYWITLDVDNKAVRVLRRMKEGQHRWCSDRWNEALLISLDCITADMENQTYALTEKGEEGLEFFSDP
jgi:hypothetical protein